MAPIYWFDYAIILISIGFGLVLSTIFLFASIKNDDPDNPRFFLFSVFLLLTTVFIFLQMGTSGQSLFSFPIPADTSRQGFWFSNVLMSASFFWFLRGVLGVKPAAAWRVLGTAFGITLLVGLALSTDRIGEFLPPLSLPVAYLVIPVGIKLGAFGLYRKVQKIKYRFFLFLPLILALGVDIPVYFSLPFSIIPTAIAVVYLGSLYTAIWLGLFFATIERGKALEIEVKQRMEANLRIQQLNQELIEAYNTTLEGWARALELRDKETEGHSRRVSELSTKLAMVMNLSNADRMNMQFGALLHDIGKMAIPDEILQKPGKLTKAERAIIEKHPIYARDLLKDIKFLHKAIEIPAHHHERWDGTGYPDGLCAEDIPLLARMFAVVDVWDALTTDRPYSKAWSHQMAKEYITTEAGRHFDPHIVEVFFTKVISL